MYHARIETSTDAIDIPQILLANVQPNCNAEHSVGFLSHVLYVVFILGGLFFGEDLVVEWMIGGNLCFSDGLIGCGLIVLRDML